MNHQPKIFLKNLVVVAVLGTVVFGLGYESAERGVFKFGRTDTVASEPTEPGPESTAGAALPTPTPLPAHFPDISESNLAGTKGRNDQFLSLAEAFKACWSDATGSAEVPSNGEMTALEAELMFGKIKKREILGKSGDSTQLGLLFDTSVFSGGAAASVTDTGGKWTDLRFRAAGRMLHCETANHCDCI